MNGVDRSDQIIAAHKVSRKCKRWWKTLFYHMIEIAVVNSFLLFQIHRKNNPNDSNLHRPRKYSLVEFREALVRQMIGLVEKDLPPVNVNVKPAHTYVTEHMPMTSDSERKNCVVCYASGKRELRVWTYCAAPQCRKFMHVGKGFTCFEEWHSENYPGHR